MSGGDDDSGDTLCLGELDQLERPKNRVFVGDSGACFSCGAADRGERVQVDGEEASIDKGDLDRELKDEGRDPADLNRGLGPAVEETGATEKDGEDRLLEECLLRCDRPTRAWVRGRGGECCID